MNKNIPLKKQQLINLIFNYDGPEKIKEDFLFFIRQCPHDFYQRNNPIGHITSSVLVVDQTYTNTLIVHHKKANYWLQPGGHWDDIKESIQASAIREVFEECFNSNPVDFQWLNQQKILDLDVHDTGHHLHFDIAFLAQIDSNLPLHLAPEEALEVKWVPLKEIVENSLYYDVRLVRMCEKFLKSKNQNKQKI